MIKRSSVAINNNYLKKTAIITTAIIMLSVTATFGFIPNEDVFAKKPGKSPEVADISNGYPSGPHFNLNIHGRDVPWNGCEDVNFPDSLGKNINVPLRTVDLDPIPQIEFITNNKKTDVATLTVLDNCTQHVQLDPLDDDPARILLPKNPIEGDGQGGYYVYARILAKPNHGNLIEPSNVVFTPNLTLLTVCNEIVVNDPLVKDLTGCNSVLVALGVVTAGSDVFDDTGGDLERFDEDQKNPQGKQTGKSKAVDITGMFYWTGAVCDETLDTDGDGTLELEDFDVIPDVVPLGSIGPEDGDGVVKAEDLDQLILLGIIDSDGLTGAQLMAIADTGGVGGEIDEEEFLALLDLLLDCDVFLEPVWIFDIADIVIHGFDYVNDGAKLVQIRFYDANAVNVQYVGEIPFLQP